MATIRSLVVSLKADTDKFEKDMRNAAKRTREAGRVMRSVATPADRYRLAISRLDVLLEKGAITQTVFNRAVRKAKFDILGTTTAMGKMRGAMAAIGIAGPAGAAAIAAMIAAMAARSVFNRIGELDKLAKTASKLGETAQNLDALRMAGELTGVAITTTDMAIQRFTRRASEAAKGTGEAQAAIRELGLDAKELARVSPFEAMQLVASAMENVTSKSDKLRLAFKLFDSEGVAMINTLSLGADGLDDIKGKMPELADETLKAARDIKDGMTMISRAWDSIRELPAASLGELRVAGRDLASVYDTQLGSNKRGPGDGVTAEMAEAQFNAEALNKATALRLANERKITEQKRAQAVVDNARLAVERKAQADWRERKQQEQAIRREQSTVRNKQQADRLFALQNQIRALSDPEGAALAARRRSMFLTVDEEKAVRGLEKKLAAEKKLTAEHEKQQAIRKKLIEDRKQAKRDIQTRITGLESANRTPIEQFREAVRDLPALIAQGLSSDAALREFDAQRKSLLGSESERTDRLPSALVSGSREAIDFINRANESQKKSGEVIQLEKNLAELRKLIDVTEDGDDRTIEAILAAQDEQVIVGGL